MVGFIMVTHNRIGSEMLATVREITKENPSILTVEVGPDDAFRLTQSKIQKAIESLKDLSGVIILTDLFGATPSNLCKEFLKNGKVEMITGVNLPILIKAATTQFKESPSQVAQFLKNYGKENIRVYSTDF